jgi:hypothetical protein
MSRAVSFGLAVLAGAATIAQAGRSSAMPRDAAAENWIVSETMSPLDYAPVTIASAWSNGQQDDSSMQLSIQCRRGRTELVIMAPALASRPGNHRVSYVVNDSPPVVLAVGPTASGSGLAIREDVVRLLTGLPRRGEIAFQVVLPQAGALYGHYALGPLTAVLERIAGPCKWPSVPRLLEQAQQPQ